MKYTDKHTVMSQFTDKNGILKVGAMLRYMQEAAANCMRADGKSYDELAGAGYAFVISKINLSIYSDVYSRDEIEVETWTQPSSRYSYPRYYRITRGGQIVAEASSVWALVDTGRGRLVRSGEIELDYRTDEPLELDLRARIDIPEQSMSLVGEREVRYTDVDRNGHMNNTVYADMICDYVFRSDREANDRERVRSMEISFISEAPFGDTLKVYLCRDGDTCYLRTLRGDSKTNIEAQIVCEK